MKADKDRRPKVVDRNPSKEIIDPSRIYSGCWIRVDCNFFPYDNMGNGVSCGITSVQFWKDGDRLDGSRSPEDAFGDSEPEEDKKPSFGSKKKSKLDDLL